VASHHGADRGSVGRAARGSEDFADLPKALGSEDAGGCDREELRVGGVILKSVDLTSRVHAESPGPISRVWPSIVHGHAPSKP